MALFVDVIIGAQQPAFLRQQGAGTFYSILFCCIQICLMIESKLRKSTHDRVVASRANENRFAGIHRKGGGAHDSCRYHFDIYRDYWLADILW
jgi:hypothetical protein